MSAARCSLLVCEVLKERGMYRDLTQVCIKMTSEVKTGTHLYMYNTTSLSSI